MARRAFSRRSSTLPCTRRASEAAAGALPGLSVAAAAAAAGGAACVAVAGVAPRVEEPLPGMKYQNAPPTNAVAATAAPINTRSGFCAPSSSSVDAAHVLDRARVDHQHLGSLAAGHALQGLVRGFDRAHPGLPAERLAELEQEVIAAGYNGDIDHRQ